MDFHAIWFQTCFNGKYADTIIDTGASAHNVIPKKIAESLGLKFVFTGNSVTTIGNEKVDMSAPLVLDFTINGYKNNHLL